MDMGLPYDENFIILTSTILTDTPVLLPCQRQVQWPGDMVTKFQIPRLPLLANYIRYIRWGTFWQYC